MVNDIQLVFHGKHIKAMIHYSVFTEMCYILDSKYFLKKDSETMFRTFFITIEGVWYARNCYKRNGLNIG